MMMVQNAGKSLSPVLPALIIQFLCNVDDLFSGTLGSAIGLVMVRFRVCLPDSQSGTHVKPPCAHKMTTLV
jgi:hypothetical protein